MPGNELEALLLFKRDMGLLHVYTFLSQIFDYSNADIEKRFLFYKVLLPMLDFRGHRHTIDSSSVVTTRHALTNKGKQPVNLEGTKLYDATDHRDRLRERA